MKHWLNTQSTVENTDHLPELRRADQCIVFQDALPAETPLSEALSHFRAQPHLPAIALLGPSDIGLQGLLVRHTLMETLAHPFRREIYLRKPCHELAQTQTLIVPAHLPLHEVSRLCSHNPDFDYFLITDLGEYLGIGSRQRLLELLGEECAVLIQHLAEDKQLLEQRVAERTQDLETARQAAEEALALKSRFLSTMSHELRTPVHAVSSLIHLLQRDHPLPAQAERLARAAQVTQHLGSLVAQALDFAKQDSPQVRTPADSDDAHLLPPEAPIPGGHILIVDDEEMNRFILQALLEDIPDIRLSYAAHGREALTLCTQQPFDLILMDLRMPEMDGVTATRAIRQIPQHRSTPIVAVTANAFSEDRQAALSAGMNDFLVKPMEPVTLQKVLRRFLPQFAG